MAPPEQLPELVLRPAVRDDVPAVQRVLTAASAQRGHPPEERRPEEVRAWLDSMVSGPVELWVAIGDKEEVVGFLGMEGDWVSLLFVDPARHREGVGSSLLELAKGLRPGGFGLRVHQANEAARGFYRSHGLVALERTDGSHQRDAAPDLQLAWPGTDPIGYLRRRIDEVDDELAVLLARRAALTGAVQDHKAAAGGYAGEAGRDAEREAQIVERMARRVPELGVDRIARVMRTVIEESLAAWTDRS